MVRDSSRDTQRYNMHGVAIESTAWQLNDVDRRIRENTRDLVRLVLEKKDRGQIQVVADFVRTLFGQRETILREMAWLGLAEGDVYREMRRSAEEKEAAAR